MAGVDRMATRLSARCLRGRAALLDLAPQWADLMARARGASPFSAPAWVLPWIEGGRVRGEIVALAAWARDELVGLCVLAVRVLAGARVAEPAGTGFPSYLGLLQDPAYPAAVERIAELCLAERVFDVLRLDDLSSHDHATGAWLQALGARGFRVARTRRNPCLTIMLGCGYEEYLRETKSKKSRETLRRKERRVLRCGDVQVLYLTDAAITPEMIERAAAIQRDSWMQERGAAVLTEPFFERLTVSAAQGGLAHLWLLTIDGQDAAFVYALVAHGELHYVWTAFRKRFEALSVGHVLTSWTIRAACDAGLLTYDFGHGDADYKRFWANGGHDVLRVVASRGSRTLPFVLAVKLRWQLERSQWLKALYRWLRLRLQRARAVGPMAIGPDEHRDR